ncbi:MAG: DUF2807 domain-containing protein [Fluviicola sp.]|nr:DUF2807 domain-containing protein [Fluviicola sp.]
MKKLVFFLLLAVVFSCKKAEDRSCFKVVGDITSKEILLGNFNKMYMGPHLKYVLVQDSVNKVVLIGGKNLLNFVETKVESSLLTINNNNKCNFFRSYSKIITVEIHYINVINIDFEGTEKVESRNQMQTNYLTLTITNGAGEFNLNINALSLNLVVSKGWGNYNLNGQVNFLKINARNNSFGESYGLSVADSIHVVSNSSETIKINADNCFLRSETNISGDIWYKGSPISIVHNSYGDGTLLDKN